MDFGKLSSVDHVNFSLPDDDSRNSKVFEYLHSRGKVAAQPTVYVGAPIWTSKNWFGKVYPAGAKTADLLRIYSRQFNTIELNTTHYRIPDEATISKWREAVPENFRFCPKFPQSISHDHMLRSCEDLTGQFCRSIMRLGACLGPCFLQLPPNFSIHEGALLQNFLRWLPPELRIAVEFRHPSWFPEGKLHQKAFDLLVRRGVTALVTDVAGRRDVLHSTLTTESVMVRFVGNSLHPSDFKRIDQWMKRLESWFSAGLSELYFFIHQPGNLLEPELISYFIKHLNEICGLTVKDWEPVPPQHPPPEQQISFFVPQ